MSFPAYDLCQESGIDWLGGIPVGWSVKSIKRLASIQYGIGEPPKYQEEGTRLVRATNIRHGAISDEGMVYVDPTHIPEQRIVWLDEGDIIVVRSGAYTGDSAIIPDSYGEAIAGFDMVLRIHDAVPQFVQYALLSNYVKECQLDLMRMRAAQPHLNAEELGGCQFVAPPLDEQKAISSFLDVETSKIDGLVSEQRRLIELLKEKRQAVISHAVTKGLNPNAPMKPSGIQWLGDVPQHWDVVALKHLVARPIIDGPHESPQKQDDGIPFVSAESIGKGFIDFDKKWGYISQEDHERYSQRYKPERGDILLVKLGATTGVPAIVETDVEFNVWVPLAAIRLKPQYQPRFIFHVLRSNNLRVAYELNWTLGTQQTLGLGSISNLRVPVPPKQEREAIVQHLDSILPSFESLTAEAERAIELLQERRTALISAAVTGKIDVRHCAYQETV